MDAFVSKCLLRSKRDKILQSAENDRTRGSMRWPPPSLRLGLATAIEGVTMRFPFDPFSTARRLPALIRAVAQLGRARRSGRRGPGFKSLQPDWYQSKICLFKCFFLPAGYLPRRPSEVLPAGMTIPCVGPIDVQHGAKAFQSTGNKIRPEL